MASQAEHALRTLFKRCIECSTQQLTCPSCPSGQICSLVPNSCTSCAHMTCIPDPSPAAPSTSSGPNVGAIAGGVIGGVAFVLVVMVLLWRFWIKKRRAQQELEADAMEWEDDVAQTKFGRFGKRSDAASTRTRGSLANSILSRASNIIPIAYIPGVTNRNGSGHNSLLHNVPVPPIPAAYANSAPKSPLSNQGDALFFRPSSTYSTNSSTTSGNRDTQYTRQSLTPSLARMSMGSEVYRDDATVEPMPAFTVTRALPRMVSVKSSQTASPTDSMTSAKQIKLVIPGQDDTARPQAPRSLSGGTIVKPNPVNVSRKGRFPVRQPSDASTAPSGRHVPSISSPLIETSTESESEEDEHARARRSLLKESGSPNSTAASTPLVQPAENPFFDASEFPLNATPPPQVNRPNPYAAMSATVGTNQDPRPRRTGDRSMGGLSAVIEEATKRASRVPSHEGIGGRRDVNPFSDSNATP